MKYERIISLLLSLALALCTLSGCGSKTNTKTDSESVDITDESSTPLEQETSVSVEPNAELLRAISADMMPEEWCAQLEDTITFKQFTDVLTRVVELWDSEKLPEWQEITSLASEAEEPMKREDGLLMLSYLWILMGRGSEFPMFFIDEEVNPDLRFTDEMREAQMSEPSWNYPYFPDWEKEVYEITHCNYMWGAVGVFPIMLSPVSGEPVIQWDENNSLRLKDALTYEDAVYMAIRFTDYCKIELDSEWHEYVSVSEVGTYNKEIITDTLLNAPSDLPEVTQSKLPSEWKGSGISARKSFVEQYLHFQESDIAFLSENGFNFTRLFLNFPTFRYPDYPDDPYMVNVMELEELDQLLAWCMEYGVHLQITMQRYMYEDGNHAQEDPYDMPASDEAWALTQAYWTMLTKRYAGISSKYLSFDLCNETEPTQNNIQMQKAKLEELVNSMRKADPERVLLYSQGNKGNIAWTEAFASLGVAVGCHPYVPTFTTSGDLHYLQQNPYAKAVWPLAYFPMGKIMEGKAALQISGDISGAKIGIHIWNSGSSPVIGIYADGQLVEKIKPEGIPNEWGEYNYNDIIYYVQLPESVENISIKIEDEFAQIDTVLIEKNGITTTIVPSDTLDYPDYTDPLPLIVNGDGTYTNSESLMYDPELIYKEAIEPYQKIAEQYDVGFMVNEFGMFGTSVHWDIDTVTAFHKTYLELLEEKNIPWCYCEMFNLFPKHLVILYGNESQWTNATEEDITYTLKDGSEVTLKVCKELLDVFREYTLK